MRPSVVRPRLGDMLVQRGAIDARQLQSALAHQRQWGRPLGQTLLEQRLCRPEPIWAALSSQLGLPFIDLDAEPLDNVPRGLVTRRVAESYGTVPLRLEGQRRERLVAAFSAPASLASVDALSSVSGKRVVPMLAADDAVQRAIDELFRGDTSARARRTAALAARLPLPTAPSPETPPRPTPATTAPGVWPHSLWTSASATEPLGTARAPLVLVHGWPQAAAAGIALLLAAEGLCARVASEDEVARAPSDAVVVMPLHEAESLRLRGRAPSSRLIVSSESPENELLRARALGALGLVPEPLDADFLVRAVRRLLRDSAS